MIEWLRQRVQDPDRTVLHRALRVAVVMPPLFAFGLHVVGDPQFALLAAFGAFATLAMADFTGPSRSRLDRLPRASERARRARACRDRREARMSHLSRSEFEQMDGGRQG